MSLLVRHRAQTYPLQHHIIAVKTICALRNLMISLHMTFAQILMQFRHQIQHAVAVVQLQHLLLLLPLRHPHITVASMEHVLVRSLLPVVRLQRHILITPSALQDVCSLLLPLPPLNHFVAMGISASHTLPSVRSVRLLQLQ